MPAKREVRYPRAQQGVGRSPRQECGHKGTPLPLPREKAEAVQGFFQHEWIVVRDIDRAVAERARELVWDHGVGAKDALHVATALDASVEQFDTFDGDLIALSGKIGNPALVIGHPNVPEPLF